MTNVLERVDIEPKEVPEPSAPKPQVRWRGLRRMWQKYCFSQPCVREFYGKLEAEAKLRAEIEADPTAD